MSSFVAGIRAAQSFREFCEKTPTEKIGRSTDFSCLADFVEAWLWYGSGVGVCHGDYHTYTIALIGIIDRWLSEPNITDYVIEPKDSDEDDQVVERRVNSIFGQSDLRHRILDRYWFEGVSFGRMHPHAASQWSK